MRIRISRKDARETHYWLRLLDSRDDSALDAERAKLLQECTELVCVFGAILKKSE